MVSQLSLQVVDFSRFAFFLYFLNGHVSFGRLPHEASLAKQLEAWISPPAPLPLSLSLNTVPSSNLFFERRAMSGLFSRSGDLTPGGASRSFQIPFLGCAITFCQL